MNFLSKTLFKQVLPQFLEIQEDSLGVEQGLLRLTRGELRKERINGTIRSMGLELTDSKYEDMQLDIPWFEFSSKAIRVDIGKLHLQLGLVEAVHQSQQTSEQPASKGIIKSYLTRIASNIELTMKEFRVSIVLPGEGGCWSLVVHGLVVKNSNLYMEENSNLRKTIMVDDVVVDRDGLELLRVGGISFCVDADEGRLKLLAVVDRISCAVSKQVFRGLENLPIRTIQTNKQNPLKRPASTISKHVSIYFKLEEFLFSCEFRAGLSLHLLTKVLEVQCWQTPHSGRGTSQLKVVLRSAELLRNDQRLIKVYNCVTSEAAGSFLSSSEHEQKIIREAELHMFSSAGDEGGRSLALKLYQFGLEIDAIQISRLLEDVQNELYEAAQMILAYAQRRPQLPQRPENEQSEDPPETVAQVSIEFVVYKNSLILVDEQRSLTFRVSLDGSVKQAELKCRLLQYDACSSGPSMKFIEVNGAQTAFKDGEIMVLVPHISLKLHMGLVNSFRRYVECSAKVSKVLSRVLSIAPQPEVAVQSDSHVPIPAPTVYLCVDDMHANIGAISNGMGEDKFVSILCLYMSQVGLKLCEHNMSNAVCKLQLIFVDQQNLTEERISNTIQIAYSTLQNNEKLVEFKNNIRLKLDTRHLLAVQRLLQQQPTTVVVSNQCKRTVRLVQPTYSIQVAPHANSSWYLLNKTFRISCGEASSADIELAFEGGVDKNITLDDRSQLVLRLVRLPSGQHNLLIRSSSYLLNCAHDMTLRHRSLGLSLSVSAQDFLSVDCEQLDQPIDKLHDFSEFSHFFSDSHLEQLSVEWLGRTHHLQLMLQSDQKYYYSVRDCQLNHQSGYFYIRPSGQGSLLFVAMPFLVVRNHTNLQLDVIITQKKSNVQFRDRMKETSQLVPPPTDSFDFYLKQFVVQVELQSLSNNIDRELVECYASEQYYFSTFAFVNEPIERVIPLRSTAKQRYDKKHLCIKQSVKLRTKVLEFACGLRVNNQTSRSFTFTVKQRTLTLDPVRLPSKQETLLPVWLRNDDQLIFGFEGDSKVTVGFQEISYGKHLLSFNFCKIGEAFRNILVMAQLSREDHGHQTMLLQDLVAITNLTSGTFLVDGMKLPPDQTLELAIPPNLLNEFNNKPMRVEAGLDQIYKRLFSQDINESLEEHSFLIRPEDSTEVVDLYKFTRETTFEVTNPADKKVYRLLKDLSKRISFYLIEDVHSPDSHYTLVHNITDRYFLLSQAPKFAGIFESYPTTPTPQTTPSKVLVQPGTSSVVLRKTDQSIFMCDSKGERLNELKPALLDKMDIRCEKNSYGLLALVEFRRKSPLRNDQLRVRNCELTLQHDGQEILSVVLKGLNVRKLEDNKYDLLMRQLTVRDIRLNLPIFSLPEETYLILECCKVHTSVLLIRNMFLKIKRVVVDVRKELFVELIRLSRSVVPRQPKEPAEPTKESLFVSFVRSPLVLVKNIFIDQFEIGLSLQMESIELKDQLQVPSYKLVNAAFRHRKLLAEIEKFYSASIVAKFPKLSFIIQNVKHPFSSIRSLFSLRDSLRHRQQQYIGWRSLTNPLHSSEGLVLRGLISLVAGQTIVACIRLSGDRRLFLTQRRLITAKNQEISSIPLQKLSQVSLQLRRDYLIAELTILNEDGLLEIAVGRRIRCPLLPLLHSVIV